MSIKIRALSATTEQNPAENTSVNSGKKRKRDETGDTTILSEDDQQALTSNGTGRALTSACSEYATSLVGYDPALSPRNQANFVAGCGENRMDLAERKKHRGKFGMSNREPNLERSGNG